MKHERRKARTQRARKEVPPPRPPKKKRKENKTPYHAVDANGGRRDAQHVSQPRRLPVRRHDRVSPRFHVARLCAARRFVGGARAPSLQGGLGVHGSRPTRVFHVSLVHSLTLINQPTRVAHVSLVHSLTLLKARLNCVKNRRGVYGKKTLVWV